MRIVTMTKVKFTATAGAVSIALLAQFAPSQAAEKVKIAASFVGLWDTSQPTFCKDRGEFEKAGLDVEIVSTRGGSETVHAVTAGGLDIAYSPGANAVLAAFMQGAKIKIISSEFIGANDIFMYVPKDSPIKTIKDMAGKTVAFPRPGGSTETMLVAFRNEQKIDFKLVATGGQDATRTMVMTKQIDVGYALPPDGVEALEKGEIRMLFSGDIVKSLRNISGRVNIASDSFLKNRRPVAIKFMQALNQCIDWMYTHKDEAVKRFAAINKIAKRTAERTLEFYSRESIAFAPLKSFDAVIKQSIDGKFIDRAPTKEQLDSLIDIVYRPKN
jgi:NitT/TauT family transport system substrate-binding protein